VKAVEKLGGFNSACNRLDLQFDHRHPFAIVNLFQSCLAFAAVRSDPCHDRAARGTKDNNDDDFHG